MDMDGHIVEIKSVIKKDIFGCGHGLRKKVKNIDLKLV